MKILPDLGISLSQRKANAWIDELKKLRQQEVRSMRKRLIALGQIVQLQVLRNAERAAVFEADIFDEREEPGYIVFVFGPPRGPWGHAIGGLIQCPEINQAVFFGKRRHVA
jgi:hypothetical protein